MSHRTTAGLRRTVVASAALALAVPVVLTTPTSAAPTTTAPTAASANAVTAACDLTWGSLPDVTAPVLSWTGAVTGVRSGQHECFDRIVFDVARGAGTLGHSVRYVSAVTSPGSGLPVAVLGGARLQITINAPATTVVPAGGTIAYPDYRTLRQLRWVSSFEGQTDIGLGVRARLPMRVVTIADADGGRRLVVDVAHTW